MADLQSKLPPRRAGFVTVALVLSNWAIQIYFAFDPSSAYEAFRWGRMSAYWLLADQWWRPLTYMFIHAGWFHLTLNTLFIFLYGRQVERALGHAGVLGLYLASGLFASLAAWLHLEPSFGATGSSGALFGLCGACFFLHYKILARVSRMQRIKALGWVVAALIAFGPNSRSALLAHALGFMAGACGMAWAWRRRFWFPRARRWWPQLLLTACAAMIAFAPLGLYPNPAKLMDASAAAINRGAYNEALAPLATLIRFFPDADWPYATRIFCLQRLGRKDEAMEEANRAILRIPASAALWRRRGEVRLLSGDAFKARVDFDEAYRLNPVDQASYFYDRGRLDLNDGAYAQACEAFTNVLYSKRDFFALLNQGLAYCALGRLTESESNWRQALADLSSPDYRALCQTYLGFLELRRGNWDEALKYADLAQASGACSLTGLLRLIAAEHSGRKKSLPDAAQVYAGLDNSNLQELKALLPPELHTYLDRFGSRLDPLEK